MLVMLVGGAILFRSLAGHLHGGREEELLVLALVAYMIILSGPIAHLTRLPVATVELLMGLFAAFLGFHETESVRILAEIGANMVLFMAGTEIDIALLRRRIRDAGLLSALIIAVPLAPAYMLAEGERQFILLAAAFSATSVAITYAILQSLGVTRARIAQAVLAAAMLSDVTGMILLNMATAGARPEMLLYSVIILAALALHPVLSRLTVHAWELEIRVIVMTIIVLGVATELVGIHSVLTSFILGIVAGEIVREKRVLREKLEGMAFGFFAPFFFVASTMKVEPGLLLESLPLIIALGVAVFAAKFLPAYAYLRGPGRVKSKRIALVYSVSLAPLLTVTLIAAEAGYKAGLIGLETYTMVMGSVIVTTILAGALASLRGARMEGEPLFH